MSETDEGPIQSSPDVDFPIPKVDGRTITLGRTTWAIELVWSRRVDAMTPGKARTMTIRDGADLFLVNGAAQYGQSNTSSGHRTGMPSLAMAMVEQADGSKLIGGFDCGDGSYYVVAVVDGQVWPGYDNLYAADEARAVVKDFVQRVDFDEIYVPQDWYIANTKITPLGELMSTARPRRHRLQGTSRRAVYGKVAAAVAIVALGYVGYSFYTDYQLQELIRQGQREQSDIETAARREAKLNAPIYPPMPSIVRGRGGQAIRQCVHFMDEIPSYTPGWTAAKIECDGSTVTMTMRVDEAGTINWLYPFIGQYKNPRLEAPTEKLATASWRLDPTTIKAWGNVRGQAPAAVSRYLSSQFQEIYQKFTLGTPNRPDINTTTVGRRPITIQAPWSTMEFELPQEGYLRDDVFDILDRVQNLVLIAIEETLPDRTWKVRGTIYHAVPPPVVPGTPP